MLFGLVMGSFWAYTVYVGKGKRYSVRKQGVGGYVTGRESMGCGLVGGVKTRYTMHNNNNDNNNNNNNINNNNNNKIENYKKLLDPDQVRL